MSKDSEDPFVCFRVDDETRVMLRELLPHGSRQAIYSIFTEKLIVFIKSNSNPHGAAALISKGQIRIEFNDPRE